ncbi:MAG: hypothetical protein HYZ85_04055 [Candidatus Omnitrophica bacterium]|nr:hypothetical protein [Candidatus Omnitrophota bacterium]
MKPLQQWTSNDIIDLIKKVDKQTWIKIAVITAVSAAFLFFIFWPAWVTRLEIRGKIKSTKEQMKTLGNLSEKRATWLRNKEDYDSLIKGAKERLFSPEEASLLLGHVSKLAKESNVGIISAVPKVYETAFPKPFDEQYSVNLYDFTVEGGYHEVGAFISNLESNAKLLQIQRVKILPNDDLPKKHTAHVSLTAVSAKGANAQ